MVDLPTFNASVKEFRSLVRENVEQNKDKKKVDERQVELMRKTLGLSEGRFKSQQKAAEEAKAGREALNDLKRQLEEQGVDVKKSKNFQKLEAEVVKKERKARLKAMTPLSAAKEQAKESATYLQGLLGKYLGPQSRIGGLLGSIAGNLKSKVTGAISSLFGLLKTGALIAGLAALLLFLDSQTWKDLKAKIIPKLEAGFIALRDALNEIIDAFMGPEGSFRGGIKKIIEKVFGADNKFGKALNRIIDTFAEQGFVAGIDNIMTEIFGTDNKFYTAIKNIGKGFFGEGGSFTKGMREIFAETFGEDSLIFAAARGLKNTFVGIATGLSDLADLLKPPYFTHEDGTPYTAGELAKKVFSAITGLVGGLVALAFLFRPAKMFMLGGKLLFKAGKWTIFKPIQAAFTSLFGALGILGTQADELAQSTLKGAGAGATQGLKGKPVKGATYEMDGKKFKFEGKQFVDVESGKIATKAQASSLRSGIKGGNISFTDPMEANKAKISKLFPKIGQLFSGPGKAILRALPFLGTLLTVGEGARILLSDAPKNEKIESLGGLLTGTLGASGLAILGGIGGTFLGGPIGTILGGVVGGGLGFLAGDYVGRKLAEFLLGDEPKAPEQSKRFSARTGGAPGANFQQSDVAKQARGQADAQQIVDLYNAVFKSNVPDANFTQLPNMNFGNVIPVGSDMATRTAAAAGTGSMGEGQVLINYQPKNTSNQINSQNRSVVNPQDIILVDGF